MAGKPGTYLIRVTRGDTLRRVFTCKTAAGALVDLTGVAAKLQVRDAAGALVAEASTANGRIALGGAAGTVTLTVPPGATGTTQPPGGYDYDLQLTYANGDVQTVLAWRFVVLPETAQ